MIKLNFSAALKTWAAVLFCTLFAFFTLVSAQDNTSKKLKEIKEFRASCTELLNEFPPVSKIEASSAFSPEEKKKMISVIAILDEGSRIEDNISDAAFSRLKKDFEGAVTLMEAFPKNNYSAAKANDSPNPDNPNPSQQACEDKCYTAVKINLVKCKGIKNSDQRYVCTVKASTIYLKCTMDCRPD